MSLYRYFRVALAVTVTATALAGTAPGAQAASNADVFTVGNVPVDVTAASANAARDRAISQAQAVGFHMLFDRLTPDSLAQSPPDWPAEKIETLVEAVEVQEERTSAVRYVAKFSVRFRPQSIRRAFQQAGIRYAEQESKPMLILAIDATGSAPILWEPETEWRKAWGDMTPPGGLVPIRLPLGDLPDLNDISVAAALSGDEAALKRIGERHGAGGVAVAVLTPTGVNATLHWFSSPPQSLTIPTEPVPGANTEPVLILTAERLVRAIGEEWAAANLLEVGEVVNLPVSVNFSGADEWAETRRRLAKVPTVVDSTIVDVSRSGARIDLHYRGDVERLRRALLQQDLILAGGVGLGPTTEESATLRLASPPPSTVPQSDAPPPATDDPTATSPTPAPSPGSPVAEPGGKL